MIKIVEVKTKNEQKAFVDFPILLYKDCKYYVPSLKIAEHNMFKENANPNSNSSGIFYLAYLNNQIVGRIGGILQAVYNEKMDQKRVRFTRFDCINNVEVAKALIGAVEDWAQNQGMQCVHGPMGFNDLEKVGIQTTNFDQMGNLIALYNFPYYSKLLEKCGYKKEAKFVEYRITIPKSYEYCFSTDNYKVLKTKNVKKLLKTYKSKVFDLINECYAPVYGAVPITPELKEMLVKEYSFIINPDFMALVTDNAGNVAGFGLAIPGISYELNLSKGKIISFESFKLIKRFKKPNYTEILFICVAPDNNKIEIEKLIRSKLIYGFNKYKISYAESNPILYGGVDFSILSDFNYIKLKEREIYFKLLDMNKPVV